MTMPESEPARDENKVEAAWQRLVEAARTSPPQAAVRPPEGFADSVLALARRDGAVARTAREERRILSWAAIVAVAVSLLVAVSSWNEVASLILTPSNVLFDDLTRWEPLP